MGRGEPGHAGASWTGRQCSSKRVCSWSPDAGTGHMRRGAGVTPRGVWGRAQSPSGALSQVSHALQKKEPFPSGDRAHEAGSSAAEPGSRDFSGVS